MKSVHLVVIDLFLPAQMAACAGLHLPALEKMLARGASVARRKYAAEPVLSLEALLCGIFDAPCRPDAPIAPVSAAFDGLGEGCWLRADPVHLRLQRDQLVLTSVETDAKDAKQLCATLNDYFSEQGLEFFAPNASRWYIRLDSAPDIMTVPLSQAEGRNVRDLLPRGKDAAQWHRVLNEIQMLLHTHPVNEAREALRELPVNSLWLWGCGTNASPHKTYEHVSSDEDLAEMFAAAAGIPFSAWATSWRNEKNRQLLVFAGLRLALKNGGLDAWRDVLQQFETTYAQPLWQALCAGKIQQLQVDFPGVDRELLLSRADTWSFWRRSTPLASYLPE